MKNETIFGAIAGDVLGSTYEFKNEKSVDINLFVEESTFTDDTVLTIAVADAILNNKDFAKTIWEYGNKYIDRGYGGSFLAWLADENPQPYLSWGNGSGMRVSAVGWAYSTLQETLDMAKKSAEVTHNDPEGIKGAQAVASAIYLARNGFSKIAIKDYISQTFDYDLNFKLDDIRENYKFYVSCQKSIPQAIVAFLESTDFESGVRLAISIGGDSDTISAMTSSVSISHYNEIPDNIYNFVKKRLPQEFIDIIDQFNEKYGIKS
jgi:ADP-ribosylglycohydrolase